MKKPRTSLMVLVGSLVLGLSVTSIFSAAVVYEPFDYAAGGLNGAGGTTEVGLAGTWNANDTALVVSNSLTYGSLPTSGNSIGDLTPSQNRFGGTRAVDSAALTTNGLLADGTVVWFSVIMGVNSNANRTNSRLGLSLANDSFNEGKGNYFVNDDGAQLGSGVGVFMAAGIPSSAQFRDAFWGSGTIGIVTGASTGYRYNTNEHGLLVGKIIWGVTAGDLDTIELYQPGTDLAMPTSAVSSLSVVVDQTTYDTITWARGESVVMDEIRLGVSYNDVVGAESTSDADSPTPNPMTFFEAPVAASTNSIRMEAAVAVDPSGVEYYFACTAGGGHDSGWQSSRLYTDTGLTAGVTNTYTVKARDLSLTGNETIPSDGFSAVPQYVDETAPSPNPLTWDVVPTAVSSTGITMTATTATDPSGVEYAFQNLTVSGHDSGWQDSPTYTDIGLSPFCSYSYQVRSRDKAYLQNEGALSEILPGVTSPADGGAPALTEGHFFWLATGGNTDYDISVTPGAAKFSSFWGAAGPIYGHFGDGTIKDYCFFHERPANDDVIEPYASGVTGLISNGVATADSNINNIGWADVWTTTDPEDDFSTTPDHSANTVVMNLSPSASGAIDISGLSEGIIYFIYGANRSRPAFDITMSGSGQADVTLLDMGDDDFANGDENYLVSAGFHNAGAYDTLSYTFKCDNGRFMGVVLWHPPQPPTGTVLYVR